ncbi:MAG: hypothetical protein V3R80_06620 [Candidatus Tectomicrobia bacterium]
MRSQQSKFLIWTVLIACAGVLGFASAGTVFAGQKNVTRQPVTCPCEGVTVGRVAWGGAYTAGTCEIYRFTQGTVRVVHSRAGVLLVNGARGLCAVEDWEDDSAQDIVRGCYGKECDACRDSLRQIAADDGVTCK